MPRIDSLLVLLLALLSAVSTAATKAAAVWNLFSNELEKTDRHYELKNDKTIVRCRSCGAPVAYKSDFIDLHDTSKAVRSRHEAVLGDDVELYTFVNPSKAEFELAGFKEVVGLEGDVFSKTPTVFADYSSHDIRCSGCKKHIGWEFYHDELEQCINTQLAESFMTKLASQNLLASTAETETKKEIVRKELEGQCVSTVIGWWTYKVCYGKEVRQFHQEPDGSRTNEWSMGVFVPKARETDASDAGTNVVHYFDGGQHCDENGDLRSTSVVYTCCQLRPKDVMIEKVDEPAMCKYLIRVCVPSLCDTKPVKEYDFAENKENIGLCKETFETFHAHAKLPSTFSTLHWSSVISEDSSELDWARRLQFAN
ncbi:unnamed protein product [Peronospora destructor]|uniref:Uncharacterized protein n=1 Tax=Peronospora destructor TaxID=86335 RepID=A0AAV0ULC3_9STRA|nr:unnamed protein product [Peronospora destructor]